jgi:8-oxo-dGTP diphosphatase
VISSGAAGEHRVGERRGGRQRCRSADRQAPGRESAGDVPAGKIETGEGPEEAAVRETWEETGFRIRATSVIGNRVHPQTGRRIVYVAATLAAETTAQIREALKDPGIRDDRELTEVRRGSLAQADELMSGAIYESVRTHLERTLQVH